MGMVGVGRGEGVATGTGEGGKACPAAAALWRGRSLVGEDACPSDRGGELLGGTWTFSCATLVLGDGGDTPLGAS